VFTNRVGDAFLLVSFLFFFTGGFFGRFVGIFHAQSAFFTCFFLGVITKRAQIPFSSWLPAAMAAPTPVSSLVHSSTLVTAGVYMLIRYNFLFFRFFWVFFFSIVTMFLAGVGAAVEKDLKKLVAISTLRQLGLIVTVICLGI
jgi:NADH-ubiquinone oxidoreductase chain 5